MSHGILLEYEHLVVWPSGHIKAHIFQSTHVDLSATLTEVTGEACKSVSLTGGHKSLLTVPCFGVGRVPQHPSR